MLDGVQGGNRASWCCATASCGAAIPFSSPTANGRASWPTRSIRPRSTNVRCGDARLWPSAWAAPTPMRSPTAKASRSPASRASASRAICGCWCGL